MSMVTRMSPSYNPNESNRNDVVYSVIAVEAIDANDFTTSTTKIINLVFRFIMMQRKMRMMVAKASM